MSFYSFYLSNRLLLVTVFFFYYYFLTISKVYHIPNNTPASCIVKLEAECCLKVGEMCETKHVTYLLSNPCQENIYSHLLVTSNFLFFFYNFVNWYLCLSTLWFYFVTGNYYYYFQLFSLITLFLCVLSIWNGYDCLFVFVFF